MKKSSVKKPTLTVVPKKEAPAKKPTKPKRKTKRAKVVREPMKKRNRFVRAWRVLRGLE